MSDEKKVQEQQKQFERQQLGRVAQVMADQMRPFIDEIRERSLAKLKGMYRTGDATESKLLAGVAELCTLDDLENKFRAKIGQGLKAGKDLQE